LHGFSPSLPQDSLFRDVKRIDWRTKAIEEGGQSELALRRAMELAKDADLRFTARRNQKQADDHAGPGAKWCRNEFGALIVAEPSWASQREPWQQLMHGYPHVRKSWRQNCFVNST
jgi:hypothetical protein